MKNKKVKSKIFHYDFIKSRKAAMEMSMGTIVTIVLLMTVLIMGMIFTRNIMCSGIQMTDDITAGMSNEIKGLFQVGESGVECVGEGDQEVVIAIDGGTKKLGCIAVSDTSKTYDFKVVSTKVLEGDIREDDIERWISVSGREGVRVAAGNDDPINIFSIKIPEGTDAFDLEIELLVTDTEGSSQGESHYMDVSFSSLGAVTSTIC